MRTRRFVTFWGALAVGVFTGGPVSAQVDVQALQQQFEREGERAAAWLQVESDRAGFAAQLAAKWAPLVQERGFTTEELESVGKLASADRLLAASQATTYEGVVAALFGTGGGDPVPQTLGQTNSDLVFFPVTPCRLIDTRLAGGLLAGGTARTFVVNGVLTGQGGNAAGCGVPVDPAAVVVTLTNDAPQGPGDLRAFAFGGAVPVASALNYGVTSQALANTTVIPVCQLCGGGDIVIQADVSGTHVLADVVGYFWSPFATALDVTLLTTIVSVSSFGSFAITSPSCPAGRTLVGGGTVWAVTPVNLLLSESGPNFLAEFFFCAGLNNSLFAVNVNCRALCGRTPGR